MISQNKFDNLFCRISISIKINFFFNLWFFKNLSDFSMQFYQTDEVNENIILQNLLLPVLFLY